MAQEFDQITATTIRELLEAGLEQDAIEFLNHIIDSMIETQEIGYLKQAVQQKVSLLVNLNRKTQAILFIDQIIAQPNLRTIDNYQQRAKLLFDTKRYKDAAGAYIDAINTANNSEELEHKYRFSLLMSGQFEALHDRISRFSEHPSLKIYSIIMSDKTDEHIQYNLMRDYTAFLEETGRHDFHDQAARFYDDYPDDPKAIFYRAESLSRLHHPHEVIWFLTQCAQENKTIESAHHRALLRNSDIGRQKPSPHQHFNDSTADIENGAFKRTDIHIAQIPDSANSMVRTADLDLVYGC